MAATSAIKSVKPKAYDPTTMQFKSQGDFDNYVKQQAMSSLQPQLDTLSSQADTNEATHSSRENDLKGWGSWESGELQQAFGNAQTAANNYIAQAKGASSDSQANLAAALGSQGTDALATQLNAGTGVPSNDNAAILAAAARFGQQGVDQASGLGGSLLGTLGQAQTLGVTQGLEGERNEQARIAQLRDQNTSDQATVMQGLPAAEDTARTNTLQLLQGNKQLADTEQNQAFQQYLAQAQYNEDVKKEGFAEWAQKQGLSQSAQQIQDTEANNLDQSKLNWATLGLNQTKVQDDYQSALAAANSTTATNTDKLRAQSWQNGLTMLQSYIGGFQTNSISVTDPTTGKPIQAKTDKTGKPETYTTAQGTTAYVPADQVQYPHWADAVRVLTGQAQMSKHDAYVLLSSSQYASWRNEANKQLKLEKMSKGNRTATTTATSGKTTTTSPTSPTGKIKKTK